MPIRGKRGGYMPIRGINTTPWDPRSNTGGVPLPAVHRISTGYPQDAHRLSTGCPQGYAHAARRTEAARGRRWVLGAGLVWVSPLGGCRAMA